MPDTALAMPQDRAAGPENGRAALAARWHLAVVSGPDPGWCHPVRRDAQSVGRDPTCDLALADPVLSRRHLEVRERRGGVEARDLGSANGTRLRVPGRLRALRLRRSPRLRARWRRLGEGTDLVAGRSVLRVRARPGLDGRPAPSAGRAVATDDAPTASPQPRLSPTMLLLSASSLPILLASGASGVRLAAFLLVPLVLLLATVRPRAGRLARPGGSRGPAASPGSVRARRTRREDPGLGSDPASVLLAACSGVADLRDGEVPGTRQDAGDAWSVLLPGGRHVDPLTDGPLALVGGAAATAAAVRWLACQLAVRHDSRAFALRLEASCGTDAASWRWVERLPQALAPDTLAPAGPPRVAAAAVLPERRLRIQVGVAPGLAGAVTSPRAATVVLVRRLEDVPPWCRSVVEVPDDDAQLVSTAWAERIGEALTRRETTRPTLRNDVGIAPLLADPLQAWPRHDAGLGAVFAVGPDGPIEVDLARDGPHALVAGTTGSGKSELLLCWVLALACRYPPSALTIVAIDYKGGATFGPLAGLPHVADVLTDLDGAGTARALAGLRAELARREHVLAAAGARDLDGYDRARRAGWPERRSQPALGRLLVVVDEFRALADEHPELLAGLARLAAQGRSLGIHLVLATQRPAGALSADLRANLRVAICLRVLSAGDSLDVVGSTDAARLPAVPGRAILQGIGPGATGDVVQAAWGGTEGVARAVEQVEAASEEHAQSRAEPLWAPPLPTRVAADRAAEWADATAAGGLTLALRDLPDERRLATWAWPASGPLIIAGGPGTGRTTALRTLAAEALSRGWTVHVVHGPGAPLGGTARHRLADHPCLGTVVGTADPRRLGRLLDLIEDAPGPALLCVDDVDAVLAACERASGPSGTERLARILRAAAVGALAVAVAGPLDVVGARWAASARHRIVLGRLDGTQAAIAGVPRAMLPMRSGPGRGFLLGDGPATEVQVFRPGSLRAPPAPPDPADPRDSPRGTRPRLRPIPRAPSADEILAHAGLRGGHPAHEAADGGSVSSSAEPARERAVPLGLGGDDAGVVWLGVGPGVRVVVAGPPGSGRTSALAWLADRLTDLGMTVQRASPKDSWPPDESHRCPQDVALLVDDADLLDRDAADHAAQQWRNRRGVVVAVARTSNLTSGYGGLSALLRDCRDVLVLAPLRGGAGHLPVGDVIPHADPAEPRRPGRGVLVGPQRAVPVQLPSPAREGT